MMKHFLALGIGLVVAVLARHTLRPDPVVAQPPAVPAIGARGFDVPGEAVSEIERLLASARHSNRTPARLRELQRAIDRWLLADPRACIVWLQDRKATGLIRADLLPTVCALRLDGRMTEVMRLASVITDPLLHYALIAAAFEVAAELHPREAFDVLSAIPAAKRSKLGQDFVARWARKDGRAAWEAVSAMSDHTQLIQMVRPCLAAWSYNDPEGLFRYLREQIADPTRKSPLEWGLLTLAGDAPATILKLLSGYERTSRLQSVWETALASVGKDSFGTALRYAQMEPAGPRRQFALFSLGLGLASSDNTAQFKTLVSELNPDALRELEPARISWLFRFNPGEISAIVQDQFPNPLSRSAAMSQYAEAQLYNQPQALIEMALNARSSEDVPDWLDAIASRLRTDPVSSKPGTDKWLAKLDPPTCERLAPELQRRLNVEDWNRVKPHFQSTPR